jgi:hypothetical protein
VAFWRRDWQRRLTARNMLPKTIKTYMEAVTGLDRFLASKGMPRSADAITREHVKAFVKGPPRAVNTGYRQQLPAAFASYLLGFAATAVLSTVVGDVRNLDAVTIAGITASVLLAGGPCLSGSERG